MVYEAQARHQYKEGIQVEGKTKFSWHIKLIQEKLHRYVLASINMVLNHNPYYSLSQKSMPGAPSGLCPGITSGSGPS